jgi:photosystem II stability/assembly factor-like uncharacterized protein
MFRRLTIRPPRRSVLVTAIALWLVGALGPLAVARTATVAPANPVATGFQPASMAFFDADHGIVGGTILCPTCIKHRTGAISTTADGGHTWSAPTTFLSAAATGLTVVPGGLDAWALVGTRLEHSSDRGATWSFRSNVGVTDPSFATATTGWGIRRTTVASTVVESLDGGATWNAGPAPCHPGARDALFVTRTTINDGWVVCGGQGAAGSLRQVVWKTTDGGMTWTRGFHGVAPSAVGYRFLDDGYGWRWHFNFADIFRSTDGGTTWHDLGAVTGGNVLVEDVWFISDTDGFALVRRANGSRRLVTSSDGGATWSGVDAFPP